VWEGRDWFEYPLPAGNPGHEGWGRVDAAGAEVRDLTPGRRVAFLSSAAFAEYDLVARDALVPLPPELDGQPFPGEPLGCAMNVFRRGEIRAGQTVAVVGVGFLGALLCRLASQAGARVIALARRPFAQRIAREYGAEVVIPMDGGRDAVEEVRELTGGQFCERVIECAGAQRPLDLAGELTGERGRLVIAGFHQDGPRKINLFLWNWRGLDVVNAHERDPRTYLEGMRMAIDAVASGRIDPLPLYTHEFPLARLGEAFEAVRTRPDGFLKALVRT
jgi:threonine dehydrogenase-like Zn-dependent dehydrogenase